MDKILDMIAKWDMLGQGCFLSFVVFMFVVLCIGIARLSVVLFRGWPTLEQADAAEDAFDIGKRKKDDKN
jgi:uncharacterized membrane protein